jgi:hypothetical protein
MSKNYFSRVLVTVTGGEVFTQSKMQDRVTNGKENKPVSNGSLKRKKRG